MVQIKAKEADYTINISWGTIEHVLREGGFLQENEEITVASLDRNIGVRVGLSSSNTKRNGKSN